MLVTVYLPGNDDIDGDFSKLINHMIWRLAMENKKGRQVDRGKEPSAQQSYLKYRTTFLMKGKILNMKYLLRVQENASVEGQQWTR